MIAERQVQAETQDSTLFLNHLHMLAKRAEKGDGASRAALARLRRTLTGRSITYDGLREIGDRLPAGLSNRSLDVHLLVGALFALNPGRATARSESIGGTLRQLRTRLSAGAESLDRRVSALLESGTEELPYRLRQLAQQLAAQGLVPDYQRLLGDLLKWDFPTRDVQRRWAKDYWVG